MAKIGIISQMDSEQSKPMDWVNLPEGVETVSLWDILHDGNLLTVESDLLTRTVTLTLDVDYVRDFHGLPEDTRFVVTLSGVQSARVVRSEIWPGEFSIPKGISREDESRLVADYQSKWREESQTWSEFELASRDHAVVLDADIAVGNSNQLALRLVVMLANGPISEVFVRAEGIKFSVGERQMEQAEFTALGEEYWQAFAANAPK
ncbi:MAG TPA: hypothetical protein VKR59_17655 [Terriglobales bacterium]|nr:hypothetical protein [Terriglobales bacterium]